MQYLIDASVYVFRAWYSMPDDMVDGDGNPVNAFYGYCRFLGDFMEQVRPEYLAVLFDESLATSMSPPRTKPGKNAVKMPAG
jgi:5'-3' exonuclease